MLIAVDYDGTYARDPDLFREWLVAGRRMGHTFVLVTGRSDTPPWGDEVRRAVAGLMPIVFAADGWKRSAAEAAGYKVDVWIDDVPGRSVAAARIASPVELSKWTPVCPPSV